MDTVSGSGDTTTERTQRVIAHYFDLMGRDADFSESYTADVTWLMADTGELVEGPDAVRSYLTALHSTMVHGQTRKLAVGHDFVYLEGDCADGPAGGDARIRYCVAYDVEGDLIKAMRCYGPLA